MDRQVTDSHRFTTLYEEKRVVTICFILAFSQFQYGHVCLVKSCIVDIVASSPSGVQPRCDSPTTYPIIDEPRGSRCRSPCRLDRQLFRPQSWYLDRLCRRSRPN